MIMFPPYQIHIHVSWGYVVIYVVILPSFLGTVQFHTGNSSSGSDPRASKVHH